MVEPVATPKLPGPVFKTTSASLGNDHELSSSPGFGTPAYPIASRPARVPQPFAAPLANAASVLPILLPPQILRPVAFRTLTKKHNLTLTSSGLGLLSTFIGRYCGSGWREDGLAERVLDEVARSWRRAGGNVLIEDGPDKKLTAILKSLESCMSGGRLDTGKLSRGNSSLGGSMLSRQNSMVSRPGPSRDDSQTSLGISALDVDDNREGEEAIEEPLKQDARSYMKVVSAFIQPRLMYSTTKKSLETVTAPASYLPPIQHKTAMFRNRYNLVHQRLMRNESFQTPSFAIRGPPSLLKSASNAATIQQAYKITPVSNLLGRSGSSHLLLGLLVLSPTGDLSLTDLSGSVVLELSSTRPVPEDGAWFCPGMLVLIEGIYEEDGSNNSALGGAGGVGGQIKGRFVAETMAGPPAERRDLTIGIGSSVNTDGAHTSVGAGFGWIDFLGTGSEKALGPQMRRLQRRLLEKTATIDEARTTRVKIAIIGECCLDNPRTLDAIRGILTTYTASGEAGDRPLSLVLTGNFVSAASMAGSSKGGGSVEYKEYFDALASVLSEFPALLSSTSFVFVPGDNDPWASSFSAGAAVAIPREGVPEIFTSRLRRAIAAANTEAGRKDGDGAGEAIWTSNPARISIFGPVEEMVLFRDDITGRLRRSAVTFAKAHTEESEEVENHEGSQQIDSQTSESMETDLAVEEATSHVPKSNLTSGTGDADSATARRLVKTILDQGHLSPFPLSTRPVLWDYGSALTLYPLPTALMLADAEAPAFAVTYEGCHVMNPGRVMDDLGARKGIAKWVEYDIKQKRGVVRETRF